MMPRRIAQAWLGIMLLGAEAWAADGNLILLRFDQPAPMRLILLEDAATARPPAASPMPPQLGELAPMQPTPLDDAAAAPSLAENAPPPAPVRSAAPQVGLALGLRQDNLNWSIGIPDTGPNVLSELDWQRVRLTTLTATLEQPIVQKLWLKGWLGAGKIWQGDNRDSDWLENDRNNEFSRSYQSTPGHSAFDAGLELSWRLPLGAAHDSYLAPQIGYAWSNLFLRMQDGVRVIAPVFDANGDLQGGTPVNEPIPGLDSTYDANWAGPYLGLSGHWRLSQAISLNGSVQRHYSRYRGEGDWNLRTDFSHPVSFKHWGDGSGWSAGLELAWQRDARLSYALRLDARRFSLKNGVDETYFSDGSQSRIRLNEVEWDSATLFLGLQYKW